MLELLEGFCLSTFLAFYAFSPFNLPFLFAPVLSLLPSLQVSQCFSRQNHLSFIIRSPQWQRDHRLCFVQCLRVETSAFVSFLALHKGKLNRRIAAVPRVSHPCSNRQKCSLSYACAMLELDSL